jgi:gamma-glutamyl-gamma-aminobutyrate hydrolase PuuD
LIAGLIEQLKNWVQEASLSQPLSPSKAVTPIKIAHLLRQHGMSLTLKNIKFDNIHWLKNTDLSGINFQHCQFNSVQLSNTLIENAAFNHCNFFQTNFSAASIKHCYFADSHFDQTDFLQSTLEHTDFHDQSYFNLCSFENAQIRNTVFDSVTLKDTHFFNAQAHQNTLRKALLEDVSFMQEQPTKWRRIKTQTRHIKPKVSILTNPTQPGLTTPKALDKLIQEARVSPLRIAYVQAELPQRPLSQSGSGSADGIDDRQINAEVSQVLSDIQQASAQRADIQKTASEHLSIPQQMIQWVTHNPGQYEALEKIFHRAAQLASQLDAVYLPGGEDVPPALYGQTEQPETQWSKEYRRALLEIGLIHQSQQKGIPLMAICRGFQITSVYHGGRLTQHLEGQKGLQTFTLNPEQTASQYQRLFKKGSKERPLTSAVLHHQGIAANDLPQHRLAHSVVYPVRQDAKAITLFVKAAENQQGASAPAILLQFHPEFYAQGTQYDLPETLPKELDPSGMSNTNDEFWSLLSEAAKTFENKRRVNHELKMRFRHI